ncbi:MAG: hypothetical protein ABJ364_08385, partial [Lentilitoribacter sp.]
GGGGNTGAGINGADAAAQIDGTIYITNPETVGGDVFNPFCVNLAEQLFQNVRDFRNSGFGLSEGDDAAGIPEGGNDQRNGALGRVSGTASNNAENVNVLGPVLGEVTGPTVRPVGQVLDDTSTREEGRAEAVRICEQCGVELLALEERLSGLEGTKEVRLLEALNLDAGEGAFLANPENQALGQQDLDNLILRIGVPFGISADEIKEELESTRKEAEKNAQEILDRAASNASEIERTNAEQDNVAARIRDLKLRLANAERRRDAILARPSTSVLAEQSQNILDGEQSSVELNNIFEQLNRANGLQTSLNLELRDLLQDRVVQSLDEPSKEELIQELQNEELLERLAFIAFDQAKIREVSNARAAVFGGIEELKKQIA